MVPGSRLTLPPSLEVCRCLVREEPCSQSDVSIASIPGSSSSSSSSFVSLYLALLPVRCRSRRDDDEDEDRDTSAAASAPLITYGHSDVKSSYLVSLIVFDKQQIPEALPLKTSSLSTGSVVTLFVGLIDEVTSRRAGLVQRWVTSISSQATQLANLA